MTPAGQILRREIERSGPISFHRFMEVALYHPEYGYYGRRRDPFGTQGDFYTAEQIQPVFGLLIAACVRTLFEEMGRPSGFTVVELGAGRAAMAEALADFRYIPVELDSGSLPRDFLGVVFCNEFFDALPVHVAVRRGGLFRERKVGVRDGRFVWVEGDAVSPEVGPYLDRAAPNADEGAVLEVNLEALEWVARIAAGLREGFLLVIDYGYTARELIRFPNGTLMGYRRHAALEDVLSDPGERDITAHVNFTELERCGRQHGFVTVRFETLAQTLMGAGERDRFAAVLAGETPQEELRRRLQLKHLLFGMGETFRTLLQSRAGGQQKRPRSLGAPVEL